MLIAESLQDQEKRSELFLKVLKWTVIEGVATV